METLILRYSQVCSNVIGKAFTRELAVTSVVHQPFNKKIIAPMTGDAVRACFQRWHSTAVGKEDGIVILPVPESRYNDVLDHVTPIFLRDEPLSHCFSPCKTGQREQDFRQYATSQLRSGLCVMALEPRGSNVEDVLRTGVVVGSCLNRALARTKVMEIQPEEYEDSGQRDPLNYSVLRLLTSIHRELDLFSAMAVSEVLEIGLASVEPTHIGKGLATRMMRISLELAAIKGFKVAKADATGTASAKACQRAGMVPIHKVLYKDYKLDGKVVFGNPAAGNSQLMVLAAQLLPTEPFVVPLSFKCKV